MLQVALATFVLRNPELIIPNPSARTLRMGASHLACSLRYLCADCVVLYLQ